ncbi:MAG: dTDP-4-dehydrorhamnose 3,5-epimerase [Thermoplasmatales archaeon]|nr:dTDP-4-dehydrorhamnose 3,5-epimerase [Thermoplasmatales archaeon]
MSFEFTPARISGVVFIKKKYFSDTRGALMKEYEITPFANVVSDPFKEEYISNSKKNVLRGLHFQREPKAQGKLISIIKGQIFDVAVDIRPLSPTYLRYVSKTLSAESNESIWIPPGFAHGFLSLSEESIVLNRCTNEFDPTLEGGIRWDDPLVNIHWPISEPILSDKDNNWPLLSGSALQSNS